MRRWKGGKALSRMMSAAVVIGALGTAAGCTTYQAGTKSWQHAAAAEMLPVEAWPERKTDELDAIIARTPAVITELIDVPETGGAASARPEGTADASQTAPIAASATPIEGPAPGQASAEDERPAIVKLAPRPQEGTRVAYTGRHGQGIIRVLERDHRRGGDRPPTRWIRFVSYSTLPTRPRDPRLDRFFKRMLDGLARREQESGSKRRPNDPEILRMSYEGTGITIEPPASGVAARGTIVHMAGLGSMSYEIDMLEELKRRGWWVVRIATPRVWWFEARQHYIASREAVPQVAKEIAREVDDLLAESAYTAEAAIDYIAKQRPEVPLEPLVMVGCSAGALATPAVVARMPEKFSAVVLVGGGANLLEISQKSDLTNAGIELRWPENQPRGGWRSELFSAYLKASTLDPFTTAAQMRDKPVLMVHANLDSTVPADNGWLLWKQLGEPDRYVHVVGHRVLFLTLHTQARRIAEWIDAAVASRASFASE